MKAFSFPCGELERRTGGLSKGTPRKGSNGTVSRHREVGRKRICTSHASINKGVRIMWDIIISLFYRQSCKASLSAIRIQNQLTA
jgi:hypothetical protein